MKYYIATECPNPRYVSRFSLHSFPNCPLSTQLDTHEDKNEPRLFFDTFEEATLVCKLINNHSKRFIFTVTED